MNSKTAREQAIILAELISKLMRKLNKLDTDDPTMIMSIAQMRVCLMLREKPRTMTCLSKILGISLSATTQIADRLERECLVERIADETDHRVKRLCLTSQGEAIVNARKEKRIHRLNQALDTLPEQDRKSIATAIERLLEACSITDDQPISDLPPVVEQLLN